MKGMVLGFGFSETLAASKTGAHNPDQESAGAHPLHVFAAAHGFWKLGGSKSHPQCKRNPKPSTSKRETLEP